MRKLGLALAVLVACGGEEAEEVSSPGPSLPLAVGNWWAYLNPDSSLDTLRVVGESTYEGRQGYLLVGRVFAMAGDTTTDTTLAFLDGGYVNLLASYPVLYDTLTVSVRFVPEELELGASWIALDYYASVYLPPPWDTTHPYLVHLFIDASALDTEVVSAPAGEFAPSYMVRYASKITLEGDPFVMDTAWVWFYPGVGMVKTRYAEGATPDTDSIRLLYDYHIE